MIDWVERHDKERELAERVSKLLDKDLVQVLMTPLQDIIEALVEVIERERTPNA